VIERPIYLHVVLVRTLYEMNVGATSRAMANMGFEKMILIDRQCELTYAAQQAAASGQKAWQNRAEYKTWQDFFSNEPEGLRLAFSARDGRERPVWDWHERLQWLAQNETRLQETTSTPLPVYLIFGPEDWGLSNDDLAYAHFNCNIPTFGENSSLNLAQAVLLALYQLRLDWGGTRTVLDGQQPPRANSIAQVSPEVFPDRTLRTWLETMGLDLTKDLNAFTVLRRMMLHNVPTEKELNMLETTLQQSIRRMKK
jgi:tRNA/rRNA methyltransferase